MIQLRGHGTLVVAQYTSEGIAVASDSLQISKRIDGTIHHKTEVRKLFLTLDKRTLCALTDLSTYTEDEKEVNFGETIERTARDCPSDFLFRAKCDLIAHELARVLQELSVALSGYPERTISTLLFFGYQGQGARFSVRQFDHEGKTIIPRVMDRTIKSSALRVFGRSKAIEARMAAMGIESQKVGETIVVCPVPDSSLAEAASFVRSLISESIEAEPEILGSPVQVATIPRNPKMEPTFSE
jgi:hypothetical protein